MNASWERITTLFGAARLLDPGTRDAFLVAACGDDADLRGEVDRLLEESERDDSFLAAPAWLNASPVPSPLLEPGNLLKDRYRIEERVATGGQAIVYAALDTVLTRRVIVKVMRAAGHDNQRLKTRFEHEMKALARIDHPSVIGILDVGELGDGSPFLVIQYVDGVSLREALQQGPLAPARIARLLRELGSALSAAHAAGVAHQDLKPENIMIQRLADGESLKLIDFGVSKIDRANIDADVTSVTIAGTIRYMAPEQFQGVNSPAADVYALALVACEMISGHPDGRALPKHAGRRMHALIDAALAFRPDARPTDVRRWCDEVASALVRRPGRRYWTAATAAIVLAAVALGIGMRVVPAPAKEPRRVIEKVGAFDPLVEGFQIHNDISGTVAENPQRDGYDGWRVFTQRQGHYFVDLTEEEKRRAFDRGWILTTRMRAEEGECFALVDFNGVGKRFDIVINRRGREEMVRLQTQIVPTWQGVDLPWEPADDAYHTYELRYDPGLQVADLWIDGVKRLTGYRGFSQFQGDGDVAFGVGQFESTRAAASFQNVRFEINP